MKYRSQFNFWCQKNEEFEESWERAYGIIFSQYCSSTMQLAIKEHPDFQSRIRDDPLELLIEIEKAMHVPMKLAYPVLTLIDTLSSSITIQQGDKEGILSYLKRFKAERNVVLSLFGNTILSGYVGNTVSYKAIDGTVVEKAKQQKQMKAEAQERFVAVLFLRNADGSRFGKLLPEYWQAYANEKRDIYSTDLTITFDIMRTLPMKKKTKPNNAKQDVRKKEEEDLVVDTIFIQVDSEKKGECRCY